jgi:YbgC/YbaW family acyl-CoA thioester hydrolase
MAGTFRTTRLVEFADTDMAGIVHFAQFFLFMESAEHAWLRSRGLSVTFEHEGQKFSFPRVSAACDYVRPARFQDVLEVGVEVEKIGRSSVSYRFEFSKDGQEIARGRLTTVLCRMGGERGMEAIEIPGWLREKLEGEPG